MAHSTADVDPTNSYPAADPGRPVSGLRNPSSAPDRIKKII